MLPPEDRFFEVLSNDLTLSYGDESSFTRFVNLFSFITIDCFYVLDIQQKQFHYVSSDNHFLCGYPVKDAFKEGYDFYAKIVYPKDLPLWITMWDVMLQQTNHMEMRCDKTGYFSCTFRLQRSFSSHRPLQQMVYHRVMPVRVNDTARYWICTVRSSTCKEAGKLCMYTKSGSVCKEYNFVSKRWMQKKIRPLTQSEREILILAQQDKNTQEMADSLCKSKNTIRNQIVIY